MSSSSFKSVLCFSALALSVSSCMKMDMASLSARAVSEKPFDRSLPIPPVVDGRSAAFDARAGMAEVAMGETVSALGYAGAPMLGPTIRIRQGERFKLDFKNDLGEATNIHWHGLEVPSAQDGYPTDAIAPGGSFDYDFEVKNRPGTYWYHPHPDMATASQAYRGLAGFFLIGSAEEDALGLPSGALDIPLVVQDKRLGDKMAYAPNDEDRSVGLFGETVLVNGAAGAVLDMATRTYRFRLLNGSNARIYDFALSTGAALRLIGTDGGLLGAPIEVKSILLAPGERADVLIDFGKNAVGDAVFLKSDTFSGSASQGKQAFNVLKFNVSKKENDSFSLPAVLMPVSPIAESEAVEVRTFNIGHGMMSSRKMSMAAHTIDGKSFDAGRRDLTVKAGSVEIWEFDNSHGTEPHPMHLHAAPFQVIARLGGRGRIEPWEKGWKDTVLALPGEKVRIIVRFPSDKGKYVFHCHNLEHEDGGMMLNFEIL